MRRKCIFLALVITPLLFEKASCQDPQYSQFYAAPLYLNPAFAGSALEARVGLNYRNQWPQIGNANFETFAAYFDTYFDEYNSGVGFIASTDKEGFAGLRSTSLNLQYAYQLKVTDKITFRPGVSVGYMIRDLDFSRLTFGNQFDPTSGTFDPTLPGEPGLGGSNGSVGLLDIGFGGLVYTNDWWIGLSAFHLNEPDQSFFQDGSSTLPARYSLHGGYKFYLNNEPFDNDYNRKREVSITPTVHYKFQGDFDQLDAGVYFVYQPFVGGVWYRGLPVKTLDGQSNNEALIFMAGLQEVRGWTFGYSFDFTLSDLGISSGGAHEVSISYHFPLTQKKLPPKEKRFVPCPKI